MKLEFESVSWFGESFEKIYIELRKDMGRRYVKM